MKVEIIRVRKGIFLPRAKAILAQLSYLNRDQCDRIVDEISKHGQHKILMIKDDISALDWNVFSDTFEVYQIPHLKAGSASQFVDSEAEDEDEDEDFDEEDPTAMQLFCIKTEAKTGNKYELLVLATTKEIALEHAIRDPAVVKSINIVPGPFTNGTVLSTRLITK